MKRALSYAVWILPLITFFLNLGSAPLFDVDEGAFSEATREMFERGDFLSTYLNGEHRFDKPILIYWLQALGVLIFGVNEWAFRFPSAMAACGWSYATWYFAREHFDEETARASLTIAATAAGCLAIGRAATADALLNCLLALTLFDGWRHIESGKKAPLLRAWLWIGLGLLTKGPIAVIVPAAVVFVYCASLRHWRTLWQTAFTPTGWLIAIVVAAPWYLYQLHTHGQLFIDGFFLRHNLQRFSGTLEGHSGSLFYYVIAIPALMLPWTGALFASIAHVREDFRIEIRRFLWLWAGFVLVFFSISGTKLPHYALYGVTPLFLLIALHRKNLRQGPIHILVPMLLLMLIALLPWIASFLSKHPSTPENYQALLGQALNIAGHYWVVAPLLALLILVVTSRLTRDRAWPALSLGSLFCGILLSGWAWPFVGQLLQGPVKAVTLHSRQYSEPVVLWRTTAPSVSVYRQAVTPRRAPTSGELAIIRQDRLIGKDVDILFAQPGYALVRQHPVTQAEETRP